MLYLKHSYDTLILNKQSLNENVIIFTENNREAQLGYFDFKQTEFQREQKQ